MDLGCASFDQQKLICGCLEPRTDFSIRPLHADPSCAGWSEAEVCPAQLASGMPTADGQLAPQDSAADLDLDPGANRA